MLIHGFLLLLHVQSNCVKRGQTPEANDEAKVRTIRLRPKGQGRDWGRGQELILWKWQGRSKLKVLWCYQGQSTTTEAKSRPIA